MRLSRHAAFRRAVGAIDGCYIRLRAPGKALRECSYNRKLYPSTLLQAICDYNAKFWDIFVGFPGYVFMSHNNHTLHVAFSSLEIVVTPV